jgi:hypothetical protein
MSQDDFDEEMFDSSFTSSLLSDSDEGEGGEEDDDYDSEDEQVNSDSD